ncbi:GNAT family N-acetyltransferase [Paracoccus sp. MC1862]|nr:GNAT family N-acetyltransferase [Paracoccus sp. MC1862]QQO44267.1 GNAT family N-acetyltransferase [Paracoccus sp. MC1862]
MAIKSDAVLGWMGLRFHPEDRISELFAIAAGPVCKRQGIARALIERAASKFRKAGLAFVMIETGTDPGHAPLQTTYGKPVPSNGP